MIEVIFDFNIECKSVIWVTIEELLYLFQRWNAEACPVLGISKCSLTRLSLVISLSLKSMILSYGFFCSFLKLGAD